MDRRRRAGSDTDGTFQGTRWDKRLYSAMMLCYAALFAAFALNPGRGGQGLRIAVIIGELCLLCLAWRGLRMGVVIVAADRVRVFGAVRTRTFRRGDGTRFEVRTMRLAFLASPHRVLVATRRDGRSIALRAANARLSKDGSPTWVDRAAEQATSVLAA